MPEKTRDRKNWFPRFKSNWLGTFRSKQMFVCCECAVVDAESARYKGAEGKHCVCGRDQWHLAKQVEEAEYNRRMEISKSFGGIRYEEAVERLKGMGGDLEYDDKRIRCESEESSVSTSSMTSSDSVDYPRVKTEALSPASRAGYMHELKLSMGPNVYNTYDQSMYHKQAAAYPPNHPNYTPLGVDTMGPAAYDHMVPPPFGTDEESFGELLQGILEEDPRSAMHAKMHAARAAPYPQYSHMKRYPVPGTDSSMLPPPPQQMGDMDFEFYHGMPQQHPHPQAAHAYTGYHHGYHPQQMVQPVASASFPSAV